jgi:hypothetical protein
MRSRRQPRAPLCGQRCPVTALARSSANRQDKVGTSLTAPITRLLSDLAPPIARRAAVLRTLRNQDDYLPMLAVGQYAIAVRGGAAMT